MLDSRKIEVLEWTIANQQNYIDALQSTVRELKKKLDTNKDNLDYLVEKGVLSGLVNETLVEAMKLDINLRENNYLVSKEDIDDYFTK